VVQELGPNSLDMQGVGSNQTVKDYPGIGYDRLLSNAAKTLPDGTLFLRSREAGPRTRESWEVAADGHVCTFSCAKARRFTTAARSRQRMFKWSFDRPQVGGFRRSRCQPARIDKAEQFVS